MNDFIKQLRENSKPIAEYVDMIQDPKHPQHIPDDPGNALRGFIGVDQMTRSEVQAHEAALPEMMGFAAAPVRTYGRFPVNELEKQMIQASDKLGNLELRPPEFMNSFMELYSKSDPNLTYMNRKFSNQLMDAFQDVHKRNHIQEFLSKNPDEFQMKDHVSLIDEDLADRLKQLGGFMRKDGPETEKLMMDALRDRMNGVTNKLPDGLEVNYGGDGWYYVEKAGEAGKGAMAAGKSREEAIADYFKKGTE